MLRIQMKHNISILLKNVKILALNTVKIQRLLLNTQMIWIIFMKILESTIQVRNEKY